MIVLGIDPGYATIGFGVLEKRGAKLTHIQHGVITTPPELSLSARLHLIWEDMQTILRLYKPDAMAVEELFFSKNITTGIAVAHARGVILLAGASAGVPIAEYGPMQVKMAVVGYGKAEKMQVMDMTMRLLGLTNPPKPDDAADALAIAICHSHSLREATARKGEQLQ